jgi:hypothetical protein
LVAVGDRLDQFRALGRQALRDLFDQDHPFGRLALVQVLMLSGDTLVTISLAGSLFFSISPTEAKSKVFLYLVLTLAPFAIVSPLLGPLIDRSRGARRTMVVFSALGRAVICPFMARDIHSLLLFPLAFLILVLSKLYLVTRGALVPEMLRLTEEAAGPGAPAAGADGDEFDPDLGDLPTLGHGEAIGLPPAPEDRTAEGAGMPGSARQRRSGAVKLELAAVNARLTLLGTLAGFVVSIPGLILLKLAGAPGVLIFGALVFVGAGIAGARLPVSRPGLAGSGSPRPSTSSRPDPRPATVGRGGDGADEAVASNPDLAALQPIAHPEVLLGLTTMSLIRGIAGFLVFLLAFGLRREHAALGWYGAALAASGVGALLGLVLVARLRERFAEQQILLMAIWLMALVGVAAAAWGTLPAQVLLAMVVGIAGSIAQPSFDAMAQRYVPPAAQGRAFARFATRQQLVWCFGALIPVVVAIPFPAGDIVIAAVGGVGGLFYVTSRRALRTRALPHQSSPRPHPRGHET